MSDGIFDAFRWLTEEQAVYLRDDSNNDDEDDYLSVLDEDTVVGGVTLEEWYRDLNKRLEIERKKCTCGSETTYGLNVAKELHSEWCDLQENT